MHASELGCGQQSISNHLFIARVAPVYNLLRKMRNMVLVTFMCLGKLTSLLDIIKALSSVQAFLQYHLYIYISSSMQACVFVVCILHLNIRFSVGVINNF